MATKRILELYDPEKTYIAPGTPKDADGNPAPDRAVMTLANIRNSFPFAGYVPCIAATDDSGVMLFGFYSLSERCKSLGVDRTGMTDAEAVEAVAEAWYQAELDAEGDPTESSAEERIAAALELANVMNMPTVNEDDPDAE